MRKCPSILQICATTFWFASLWRWILTVAGYLHLGHLADAVVQSCHVRCRPAHREQFGVQCLTQRYFDMQTRGIETDDLALPLSHRIMSPNSPQSLHKLIYPLKKTMDISPQSPDLNSSEHLWGLRDSHSVTSQEACGTCNIQYVQQYFWNRFKSTSLMFRLVPKSNITIFLTK